MDIKLDDSFWQAEGEYNRELHPELSFDRGEYHYVNGRRTEALLDFANYLKHFPEDFQSMMYIAEIYFHSKRYAESISYYENAFSKAKGQFANHIYSNYASALHMVGQYEKGLKVIDEFLAREKHFSMAYVVKAQILFQQDLLENAFYFCVKAIECDSKNWQAFTIRLKVSYRLKDFYRVQHDFLNAQILNPQLPAINYTTYAFALYNSGKTAEAVVQFQKADLLGDVEAKNWLIKFNSQENKQS